jgi:hypothetical protein
LPEPCKPASRNTAGGCVAKLSGSAVPPISAVSSRATTPISAWPGVSDPTTSAPIAFSRRSLTNVRTTGNATSASSSARRTSRSASWMFASVSRASPRSVFTTRDSRSVSVSSMGGYGRRAAGSLAAVR